MVVGIAVSIIHPSTLTRLMLLFFVETFAICAAETAGLGEFPARIPLRQIPKFVKVTQVVRIDSMVMVNLTDTDYGHALKWDSAVR